MFMRASDIASRVSYSRNTLLSAPWRLVLLYSVFGVVWVIGTSFVIKHLEWPEWSYTFRALIFVFFTAASGWWFTRRLTHIAIQTQRLISESEGDYRALFEIHPAPMWLYDKNSLLIIKANEAACRTYGYGAAQFTQLSIVDLYAPDDKEKLSTPSVKAAITSQRLSGIHRHISQSGKVLDVDVLCHEHIFEEQPYGLLMAQNISAHFELEKKLTYSLRQLELAQHIGMMGYWERDLSSQSIHWSPEIYSILDLDPEQNGLTFERFLSLIHRDDRARMARVYQETVSAGQTTHEYRVTRINGELRHIFERTQVLEDERGHAVTLFGTFIDVSEIKVAEQALVRQQQRYKHMIDSLPEGVLIIRQSRITYANNAARQMFAEQASAKLSTLDIRQFFHADYRDREVDRLDALHKGLTKEQSFRHIKLLRLDGSEFEAELAEIILEENDQRDVQLLIRDISQASQMRHDLESANKSLQRLSQRLIEVQELERRQLARDLHDDIGQQLTGIKLHLQRLVRKLAHEPEIRTLANDLSQGVDDALAKVRSLSLSLHPLQLETLGLEAAVRWHLSQFLGATHTQWELHIEGGLDKLSSNITVVAFRLIQEAVNNVAKHSQAASVRISLIREAGQLRLEILDDGCGFDIGDASREARSLGLTSMHERVASLNGKMKISSISGMGTRITAVLPVVQ
jgi:PAS domain S-box-containing protein